MYRKRFLRELSDDESTQLQFNFNQWLQQQGMELQAGKTWQDILAANDRVYAYVDSWIPFHKYYGHAKAAERSLSLDNRLLPLVRTYLVFTSRWSYPRTYVDKLQTWGRVIAWLNKATDIYLEKEELYGTQ